MALQYQGWAYVSCSSGGGHAHPGTASAQGPTGSLQFHSGSSVPGGSGISGSASLLYLTASSQLILTGNLLVSGNIIARNFDVINHTVTFLSSSGDSKFGDTNEDWHTFTGSIAVKRIGVAANAYTLTSSGGGSPMPRVGIGVTNPYAGLTVSGSQAVNYHTTAADYSVTSDDYFVVVSVASAVLVDLPAAATAGRGRVVVVKAATASPNLTVSASAGETIDGDSFQKLLSDHASETYVCDGTGAWYII